MEMDPRGALFNARTLWITDGKEIAAIEPPAVGSCLPPNILMQPFIVPGIAGPLTDVSWDPVSQSIWPCDNQGNVHNIDVVSGGCNIVFTMQPSVCSLMTALTGIAYDTATPAFTGSGPALYVTDGNMIAYVDAFSGGPATPTFYAPQTCTPTPFKLTGLAHSQHGIEYGAPLVSSRLGSYGQSSSPNIGGYGYEIHNNVGTAATYLLLNFNVFGTGYQCPPINGTLLVNPTNWWVISLGTLPVGCTPINFNIPPGIVSGLEVYGLEVYGQAVLKVLNGPVIVDWTNGHAVTISLP
jgi:hypothetical protein